MITHIIYLIWNRKVGCTKNVDYRKQLYLQYEGNIPEMVIVDELHDFTDQEAGDREWNWADALGYRRGVHYTVTIEQRREVSRRAFTPDRRVESGRTLIRWNNEHRTHEISSSRGYKGALKLIELGRGVHGFTAEQWSANGRKAAHSRTRGTCPHCGMEGYRFHLTRYHFDKCPHKPKIKGILTRGSFNSFNELRW